MAVETCVTNLVSPAWSALPSPSKSRLTPSRFFASMAAMSAVDKVDPAVGEEVTWSSEC